MRSALQNMEDAIPKLKPYLPELVNKFPTFPQSEHYFRGRTRVILEEVNYEMFRSIIF